jgi:hypothetical protein
MGAKAIIEQRRAASAYIEAESAQVQIRKGADERRWVDTRILPAARAAFRWPKELRYVGSVLLPELPLNGLHLVFEPQLQLLEANFLKFFVFAEITFLGETFKASGILHVLLSQLAEFIVVGQKSIIRSQHPGRPPIGE